MLRSELLLYGYGIVCVCMLVFNVVYNLTLKSRDRGLQKRCEHFKAEAYIQINRLRQGGNPHELEKHLRYLRRKLAKVGNLIAFDRAMEKILASEDSASAAYRQALQPVILQLAFVYRQRDTMQAAYFAYFLSRHKFRRQMPLDTFQDILLEYMSRNSLYCRVNALQALCGFGSPDKVVDAVLGWDRSERYCHEKIMTEGLMSFSGNHERLINLLWQRFGSFSAKMKLPVLNYIRFKSGDYGEQMLAIMNNQHEDKELRLAAIRYFGRYPCAAAREPLLDWAANQEPHNWEYAAVSAFSLAGYPGPDTEKVLLAALKSPNWYVRKNAAISLADSNSDVTALRQAAGNDRYARQMLGYQLEIEQLAKVREAV